MSELDDEVVDIGENEHPKSSISPVTIEKNLVLGNSNGIYFLWLVYIVIFVLYGTFVGVWLLHFSISKSSGP